MKSRIVLLAALMLFVWSSTGFAQDSGAANPALRDPLGDLGIPIPQVLATERPTNSKRLHEDIEVMRQLLASEFRKLTQSSPARPLNTGTNTKIGKMIPKPAPMDITMTFIKILISRLIIIVTHKKTITF